METFQTQLVNPLVNRIGDKGGGRHLEVLIKYKFENNLKSLFLIPCLSNQARAHKSSCLITYE